MRGRITTKQNLKGDMYVSFEVFFLLFSALLYFPQLFHVIAQSGVL